MVGLLQFQPEYASDDDDACHQTNQSCDFVCRHGVVEHPIELFATDGLCAHNTTRTAQFLAHIPHGPLLGPPQVGLKGKSKGNNQSMARECHGQVYGWLRGGWKPLLSEVRP